MPRKCLQCNKEFSSTNYTVKCCSRHCAQKFMRPKKQKYNCEFCNKQFMDSESQGRRFCNVQCYSKSKKGKSIPWLEKWNKEHPEAYGPRAVKSHLSQNRMKGPTSIEKAVYEALKEKGFLFETQYVVNNRFVVDAYIPSLNLIIEADGDYWHSMDKTVKKDKAENAYLNKCGYNLLRWSGTDIENRLPELLNQIKRNEFGSYYA